MAGSGGLLLLLLAAFLLASFVTGRLDWLKRLGADTRAAYQAGQPAASVPYGPTGPAPATVGRAA